MSNFKAGDRVVALTSGGYSLASIKPGDWGNVTVVNERTGGAHVHFDGKSNALYMSADEIMKFPLDGTPAADPKVAELERKVAGLETALLETVKIMREMAEEQSVMKITIKHLVRRS